MKSNQEVNNTELVKRENEITQLTQELEKITATPTRKKPDVKYISVSSKKKDDALYLDRWKKKVKLVGSKYYPQEAFKQNIKGSLLMAVALNQRGTVLRIRIIDPSGHKVLDEAAKKIVRLASPFDRIPREVMENKDELQIVWRYTFENR